MTTESKKAELNIFARTPDGFKCHVKMLDVDSDASTGTLIRMSSALHDKGFLPDEGPRATGNGGPAPVQAARREEMEAPVCNFCGGAVWDNRADKRNGKTNQKAPDFKCKDKQNCGGAAWIKDGGLRWAEG